MIKIQLTIGRGTPATVTVETAAEAALVLGRLDSGFPLKSLATVEQEQSAPAHTPRRYAKRKSGVPMWSEEEAKIVHDAVLASGDPKAFGSAERAIEIALEGLAKIGSPRTRGTLRGIVTGFRKALYYKASGTSLPRAVRAHLAKSGTPVGGTTPTNASARTSYLDGVVPSRIIKVDAPIEA